VLDDFRQPGPELALGQCLEHDRIHHHEPRLMERPDQVLASRVVDRSLSAARGIDLGQQGRRHLNEVHPTHVGGGDEAGHITDRAAPQRDVHGRRAGGPRGR